MTKTNTSHEETVRRYMLFIEDPAQLIDQAAINKATQAVADAADPIEKLKALGDLAKARNVDEVPLLEGFVSVAKQWADKAHVPASVFLDMKVPAEVLKAAGFEVEIKPTVRGKTRNGVERQRAKAVPVEDIKAHVDGITGKFLLSDIIGTIGGSTATVSKAVNELIKEGKVAKLGPVPEYGGRGRAPIQYLVNDKAA